MSSESQKQKFIAELGEDAWDENWASVARLDPEIFDASIKLCAVPRKKRHLSPKVQQLLAIAVYAAATHFYVPGIQKHIKGALAAGATQAEIIEVLECTGTLGIHACNIGVPLLVEVMKERGMIEAHPTVGKPFDEKREKLKAEFTKNRGYWHTFWEDFLALDAEFFEAYLTYSSVPWVKDVKGDGKGGGALEPKVNLLELRFQLYADVKSRSRSSCIALSMLRPLIFMCLG
jgi:alkylhydroperoxidase/carboxymuconolactone decarboxylase family protein YurZ